MATLNYSTMVNVINLGTTSSCSNYPQYCQEGYSLYFPCLKDITRGQSVCFEFYVVNNVTRDVVDLRDVDALTLDLNGLYGCSYGTYSYPDNIFSLQREEYDVLYENDFGKRTKCTLDVIAIDTENEGSEFLNEKSSVFYSKTTVRIAAYDTPTHIFMGWGVFNEDEEECEEETWEDIIFSKENVYDFEINQDYKIFALYRPRKSYTVKVSDSNRNCIFKTVYDNNEVFISNRPNEIYLDGYDHIDVLEGHKMVVECIPSESVLGESEESAYTYKFNKWIDGYDKRTRLFSIGGDTQYFENGNEILLSAICTGPVDLYDLVDESIEYEESFDKEGIHIFTVFEEDMDIPYYGDEYTQDISNGVLRYKGAEGYLVLNDGYIELSSMDIEDGVKINVYAQGDCNLQVSVNGLESNQTVLNDGFKSYEFYFSKCDKQNILIKTVGECLIDKIEICKEKIIDKGKAELCLNGEETSKIATGPIYVSGAVMVNGSAFGIAQTQIGKVNRLKKINITI